MLPNGEKIGMEVDLKLPPTAQILFFNEIKKKFEEEQRLEAEWKEKNKKKKKKKKTFNTKIPSALVLTDCVKFYLHFLLYGYTYLF